MAHAAAVATASAASTPPPVLRKSRIDFTEISSSVAFKAANAAVLPLLAATGRGGVASGAAGAGAAAAEAPTPRARARGISGLAAETAGGAAAAGAAYPLLPLLPKPGLGTDLEEAEDPVAGAPGRLAGPPPPTAPPPARFASRRSARSTPRRLASSSASSRTRPAPLPLANCGFDARSLLNSALTRCARRSRANSPPSDSSRPKRSTRRRARSRSTSTWRAW